MWGLSGMWWSLGLSITAESTSLVLLLLLLIRLGSSVKLDAFLTGGGSWPVAMVMLDAFIGLSLLFSGLLSMAFSFDMGQRRRSLHRLRLPHHSHSSHAVTCNETISGLGVYNLKPYNSNHIKEYFLVGTIVCYAAVAHLATIVFVFRDLTII